MKLGISTATFFSKLLTEDSFEVIKSFGINNCEVFLTTFCEYEPEFAKILLEKKGDMQVGSVHALNIQFEPQLFGCAKRTKEDAEIIFDKVLATAKTLGASAYTFHGQNKFKSIAYNIDFPSFGKRVEELATRALEQGVTLCYENVHWAYFDCPTFFENLKPYSKSIGCTLDIKQAMQSGIAWQDYFEVMSDRLKVVHIADYDDAGNILMPGRGIVDFDELFSRLRDIGYTGNVLVELYAKNYNSFEELGDSIEFLKQKIAKI